MRCWRVQFIIEVDVRAETKEIAMDQACIPHHPDDIEDFPPETCWSISEEEYLRSKLSIERPLEQST